MTHLVNFVFHPLQWVNTKWEQQVKCDTSFNVVVRQCPIRKIFSKFVDYT